jgi:hypothetical protein
MMPVMRDALYRASFFNDAPEHGIPSRLSGY